jgi:TetR/AcrR family transcriptional repressor of nem operon
MRASRSPVREQILEAATRLIRVQGYHRTAVDDVLRESGAGKGNFYHYFSSKEDLGLAIVDRIVHGFAAETLDPAFGDPACPPLEQIDRLFDAVLAVHRERRCVGGCPMGNLATELADVHEGFRRRLDQAFDGWRARIATALERARAEGDLTPTTDPDGLAGFLVAGLEGGILLAKVQKDIAVLETCVGELRRHLALYRVPAEAPRGGGPRG